MHSHHTKLRWDVKDNHRYVLLELLRPHTNAAYSRDIEKGCPDHSWQGFTESIERRYKIGSFGNFGRFFGPKTRLKTG